MSRQHSGVIAHFVQHSIAVGRPSKDGKFVFSRKEIIDNTGLSQSSFTRSVNDAVELISTGFDFCLNFHVPGYKIKQENVFINVCYEKGILTLERNPLTLSDEFAYMWNELTPTHDFFTYIYSTTYTDRGMSKKD